MKRFVLLLTLTVMTLCMASCALLPDSGSSQSEERLDGQDIIEKAISKYNEQESGGYEAVDNITGKVRERFVYRYDEVGFLSFLCETYSDDGSVYKEYNTGYAVYIEEDGKGSKISKSDDRFVVYNEDATRYSKASGAVFGFIDTGVDRVERTDAQDGSVRYTYIYDPDEAGVSVDGGKLISYSIAYDVNADGEVYSFRQQASGTYDSGESFEFDYTVTLIPSDSVGLIENPITVGE